MLFVFILPCYAVFVDYQTLTEIVLNDYDVPLPGMKRRDVCLAKMWVPDFVTQDGTSGNATNAHTNA